MPAIKHGVPDKPEDPKARLVVDEAWVPNPPPPACDCMVCATKRKRLAELRSPSTSASS